MNSKKQIVDAAVELSPMARAAVVAELIAELQAEGNLYMVEQEIRKEDDAEEIIADTVDALSPVDKHHATAVSDLFFNFDTGEKEGDAEIDATAFLTLMRTVGVRDLPERDALVADYRARV